MLLTLSQLPPFTVAASALQWRVTPPVFLRITLWSGGLVPPTKPLKLSCVALKSILAGPSAKQSEKREVFSPAADAVAVMFWPADIAKRVGVLPLPSVNAVVSLIKVLPCAKPPESQVGLEKNSIV